MLERHQHAVHGVAWIACYVEALKQTLGWAHRLSRQGRLGRADRSMLVLLFGEYLQQLRGGIPMSQVETARPLDLGIETEAQQLPGVTALVRLAADTDAYHCAAQRLAETRLTPPPMGDDSLDLVREQFRRFTDEKIAPRAQQWHHENALIPIETVRELGDLGVFGIALSEEWGGANLGKVAMCIASEELSRGNIGVGSLATRSEIAAEPGYRGLSILLAEKPRGDGVAPFPARGMSGTEIHVLGYRGMREYEIAFEGFEVPESNLLGGSPGNGFKQMAQAMESGRIQTAARSVGVARNALELAIGYALERRQFGRAIFEFPRIHGLLARHR